jgi:hypothetical protein
MATISYRQHAVRAGPVKGWSSDGRKIDFGKIQCAWPDMPATVPVKLAELSSFSVPVVEAIVTWPE